MASISDQITAQQAQVDALEAKTDAILAALGEGQLDPEVIEQQIQEATDEAIQEVLDTLNGLDLTELQTRTELQAKLSEIQNTYNPDVKFDVEFFDDLYSMMDSLTLSGVSTVAGDDSIDIEAITGIEVGKEYIISDGETLRTIRVAEILSSTRIRAIQSVDYSFSDATLTRSNWPVANNKATLTDGLVYYSSEINLDVSEDSDKAFVVRRTNSDIDMKLYYKRPYETDWTEAAWGWVRETDEEGYYDYEYAVPRTGDFEIKLVSQGVCIVKYIVGISRGTGLGGTHRAPSTPTVGYPADEDTDIGEQPALTVTGYSSPSGTALKGSYFEVSTDSSDFTGDNLVLQSGLVNGYSYTPSKDILQPSTTYYIRAKVEDTLGGVSEWSAVTSFTTKDTFVSIDAPSCTSPSAGEELGSPDSLTLVCSAFAYDGDEETHAASQWQIATDSLFANILLDSGEDTENLTSYTAADGTVERGGSYFWRVRHKGTTSGDWSDWSASTAFSVMALGDGVRVNGGIMIGPYVFADQTVGYLVVAPASERSGGIAWGQYNIDVSGVDSIESASIMDSNTGESNTTILTSDTYNATTDSQGVTGSPAAEYCADLTFEECSNYFLPNKDELEDIIDKQSVIDAEDETTGTLLADMGYLWSSTENNDISAHVRLPSANSYAYGAKMTLYGVAPCFRHLLDVTTERVSGGVKVGPYVFADGEVGYFIVAPATQRTKLAYGLYATDVSELDNVSSAYTKDSKTGLYNTSILTGSSYNSIVDSYSNTGSPAANYCNALTFEDQSGFFLPNKEELAFITSMYSQIDTLDDSGGANTFAAMIASYPYFLSSTENNSTLAWFNQPTQSTPFSNNGKYLNVYWIVPCRREII